MGVVIITLRVYPEDVDVNLEKIVDEAKNIISSIGGTYKEHTEVPIAFGLKAIDIQFIYPDQEFNEEELLGKIKEIPGVSDVEIVRATLSSI